MSDYRPVDVSLYKQAEEEGLSLDSSFRFHCHEGLACFNQCCRAPTIILSPYDILRLKQCLGLTSGELLERYTLPGTEELSNLPLVFIDAYSSPEGGCPFVGPAGCTVYAHRPAACRLFPITMGSGLTPQGVADYYFCRKLDYCRGFAGEVEWTVAAWQANQGFAEYDRGRRDWLEILVRQAGSRVDDRVQELVATIAYDPDRFRQAIFAPRFLPALALADQTLENLRNDDLAFLQFSYSYLKSILFAEDAAMLKAARRALCIP